jgi:hypothetical protein
MMTVKLLHIYTMLPRCPRTHARVCGERSSSRRSVQSKEWARSNAAGCLIWVFLHAFCLQVILIVIDA